MTESRTELLTWVNDLLSLNITKLEHCGSGAAYCQVFDSIYGDIPVGKVKFTGKREYEHIHNYKILQSAFNNHGVDKIIPVERLVKCKYQDNLDFLQWMKKYWDTYYPGGVYDAVQRRETASTTGDAAESPKRRVGKNNNHSSTSTAGSLTINIKPTKGPPKNNALRMELDNLRNVAHALERERNFYFSKLRDIEIVIRQKVDKVIAHFFAVEFKLMYKTVQRYRLIEQ
ncbi:EB1 protein [Cladochytrium replicatum]|nr:EB1 protein [Cladochytrium replicatum]